MIPSKIFSAVAFFGAIFLSSTSATSLPRDTKCYKCPPEIFRSVGDKKVVFDLSEPEVNHSENVLECYYVNKKDTHQQTYCVYKLEDGDIAAEGNGDGFCPAKANTEHGSQCGTR